MYLAIDVGGTKTLMAVFSEGGQIVASKKIFTDPDYDKFLDSLKEVLDSDFKDYQITYGCCAIAERLF
jgi:predicted NBD/HSP70 family sugar kinase